MQDKFYKPFIIVLQDTYTIYFKGLSGVNMTRLSSSNEKKWERFWKSGILKDDILNWDVQNLCNFSICVHITAILSLFYCDHINYLQLLIEINFKKNIVIYLLIYFRMFPVSTISLAVCTCECFTSAKELLHRALLCTVQQLHLPFEELKSKEKNECLKITQKVSGKVTHGS